MRYQEHEAVENIVRQVRLMRRFFNEVVDADPKTRTFLPELHCAYMDMLNEEFSRHALDLALALLAWEERAARLAKELGKLRRIRVKARQAVDVTVPAPTATTRRARKGKTKRVA